MEILTLIGVILVIILHLRESYLQKKQFLLIQNFIDQNKGLEKLNLETIDHTESQFDVWLKTVKSQTDSDKLEYLEAAVERFPGNKKFVDMIFTELTPYAFNSENLLVRREALMRLKKHAEIYHKYCPIDQIQNAIDIKNKVFEGIQSISLSIDEVKKERIDNSLSELEEIVTQFTKDPKNESLLTQIEMIDQEIDQDYLKEYLNGKEKYDRLSKKMIETLRQTESVTKSAMKEYNVKALRNVKKALKMIENHSESSGIISEIKDSVNYNKINNLKDLVKLISGYSYEKLLPTTVQYIRSVEMEVFNKLNDGGRESFTKLMIDEDVK